MDEAVAMMEEESNYIILDVRTPDEFREKHIPGAINIPNKTNGFSKTHIKTPFFRAVSLFFMYEQPKWTALHLLNQMVKCDIIATHMY